MLLEARLARAWIPGAGFPRSPRQLAMFPIVDESESEAETECAFNSSSQPISTEKSYGLKLHHYCKMLDYQNVCLKNVRSMLE